MGQAEYWIAAGLVLLVCEIIAPGVFLMWLGLAGIGTGLALLAAPLSFGMQSALFSALALLAIGVALWLRRGAKRAPVNTLDAGLVGRRAHALAFEGREGRVRLGDSDWPARLAGGPAPAPGEALDVTGVDGTTLLVRGIAEIAKA
jgi:membrane protein implicated in regulation of membrane protease activity